MIIRTGTIEDAERLNEIEKACFPIELRYGPTIIVALLTMTPNYIFLTVQLTPKSKIIAFAVGEQDDFEKFVGRIISIQVDPPYQGRNIGSRLLAELETRLQEEHGVKCFELQVHYQNEIAIKFYQKHGYNIKKQLKNYYKREEHAYLMEKTLPKYNPR